MIEFNTEKIMFNHNINFNELEKWLLKNIGIGGKWLNKRNADGEVFIQAEYGDEWGLFLRSGCRTIAIVDDEKATLFAVRWAS